MSNVRSKPAEVWVRYLSRLASAAMRDADDRPQLAAFRVSVEEGMCLGTISKPERVAL